MPMLRFRLIGTRASADSVIAAVHGINNVEHVEEVDDLVPMMRDDLSSSESVSDTEGQVYCIEVEVPNDDVAESVRGSAEAVAFDLDTGIEFVDDF